MENRIEDWFVSSSSTGGYLLHPTLPMPDAKPSANKPALDALVLYRNRPARVKNIAGDRIEIEFDGGSRPVRPKDVTELHPGPLSANGLAALDTSEPGSGDVDIDTARELLEDSGEEADLRTLCELLYGSFTPQTAWAGWEILSDGLWFEGTPQRVRGAFGRGGSRGNPAAPRG